MKRLYFTIVVVFALMASVAVLTANAAYPANPSSQGNSGGTVSTGEHWSGSGFRHPMAKLPQSGLRNFVAGSSLSGAKDTPPVWGTDIQVSTDNPNRPHNEMVGASNPTNPLAFISGANDYGTTSTTGYYYSINGGTTWAGANFPGPYPGGTGIDPGGDPAVDYDAAGNAYFADLGYDSGTGCTGGVYVHKSTNNGATWSAALQVTANTLLRIFNDKEWIAADRTTGSPYANRVYVTYTKFDAGPGHPDCNSGYIGSPIQLRYSSDGGATFSAEVGVGPQTANGAYNQFSDIAIANNGTVYVSYQNSPSDTSVVPLYNVITKSTNGGVSFSSPISITVPEINATGLIGNDGRQYYGANTAGSMCFRHQDMSIIGVSPTDPNTVYSVWNDGRFDTSLSLTCAGGGTGKHGDIVFSRSTNGGTTWSTPVKVNDDPAGKDQFFPWMAVGSDGTIHVMWNDRRDDPNNVLYHTYYSQSTNGGTTWSANQRVSDVASNPGKISFGGQGFIGDYNGIAVNSNNTRILPFWTDTRSSNATEQDQYTDVGQVGGGATSTPTATRVVTATPTPCVGGGWTDVASFPTNRGRALGVTVGGDVYIFGGRTDATTYTNDVYKYNIASNSYTHLTQTLPDLTTSNMGGGLLTFPEGQRIFIAGGSGTGSVVVTRTLAFNPADGSFTPKASWPTSIARLPGGWAVYNNKLYVFGGFQPLPSPGQMFPDIWVYDPTANTWTQSPASLSMARGYIATELMPDNLIYLAGGSQIDTGGSLTDETIFEKFNPATNTITAGPSLSMGRSNDHGYLVNGKFYVAAGGFNNTSTDVLIYDPATNSWSAGPPTLHDVRNYSKGYGSGGVIYMFGGIDAAGSTFFDYTQKFTPGAACPTNTPTPVATNTATPCAIPFTDVHPTDYFYNGVRYLYCKGAISGYVGNVFLPFNNTTRGQLTKIVVLGYSFTIYTPPTPTFTDVPTTYVFYTYIETAYHLNLVSGYSCGTGCLEFRPGSNVTRAQLSKIVVQAAGWALINPTTAHFSDVPRGSTFYQYIETAYCHGIISGYADGTFKPSNPATRGQICKIVYEAILNHSCTPPPAKP